jgi:anti-sigma B factor antagonist
MRIEARLVRDIHILDFRGDIKFYSGVLTIRDAVHDVLNSGANKILLNLSNVECIDEAGFAELVSGDQKVCEQGGQLKFLDSTKKLHELFLAAKFCKVFGIFESEQDAIDSF